MSRCRRRKNNNLARYQSLNTPDSDRSVEFTKSFKFNFPYELCNPPKSLKRLAIGWVSSGAIFIFIYIYIPNSPTIPLWYGKTKSHHPCSQVVISPSSLCPPLRPAGWTKFLWWGFGICWRDARHTSRPVACVHIYIYIHIQKASSYKDVYIRRYTVEYIIDLSL